MTDASPAIDLRSCRRRLDMSGNREIVFELDALTVARGEHLALTGPSGCGKSTLLNMVCGLVKPDAGEIRILDQEITKKSPHELDSFRGRHMGFIYQTFNLLEAFTALENVMIGLRFGRSIPRHDWKNRATELLDRVGLSHRLHSKPSRMSVGERQRVAIARAVAGKPEILLADEPTGALDPSTAASVMDLILEISRAEGCALLLVTHDMGLANLLPHRFDCIGLIQRAKEHAAP